MDWRSRDPLCEHAQKSGGLFLVERRILAGPPDLPGFSRLILLLFGGIPNSPSEKKCRSNQC